MDELPKDLLEARIMLHAAIKVERAAAEEAIHIADSGGSLDMMEIANAAFKKASEAVAKLESRIAKMKAREN